MKRTEREKRGNKLNGCLWHSIKIEQSCYWFLISYFLLSKNRLQACSCVSQTQLSFCSSNSFDVSILRPPTLHFPRSLHRLEIPFTFNSFRHNLWWNDMNDFSESTFLATFTWFFMSDLSPAFCLRAADISLMADRKMAFNYLGIKRTIGLAAEAECCKQAVQKRAEKWHGTNSGLNLKSKSIRLLSFQIRLILKPWKCSLQSVAAVILQGQFFASIYLKDRLLVSWTSKLIWTAGGLLSMLAGEPLKEE